MLILAVTLGLTLLAAPQTRSAATDGTVASADGVKIHYHAEGSGEPALVFVHCWSCDGTYWSNQLAEFAPKHRVVTVDLAGHGESSADRKDFTIPAFGADVAAVVRKLDLKRVVLIGHSMGGPVIVDAALQMPERVKLLVPVDSLQNAEFKVKPEDLAEFLAPFEKDFPTATKGFVRQFFPESTSPDLVEKVANDMSSAPPAIALASMRALIAYDLTDSLPRLKIPIRAISSDRRPTLLEVNRKYAPRFDVTIMKEVGHFPMLEAPKEFNRLLADAVADL